MTNTKLLRVETVVLVKLPEGTDQPKLEQTLTDLLAWWIHDNFDYVDRHPSIPAMTVRLEDYKGGDATPKEDLPNKPYKNDLANE